MRNYLFLFIWLACLPAATRGQTLEDPDLTALLQPVAAQTCQYWFDDDASNIQTAAGLSGVFTPDVSSLADGLHVIHYVVIGSDGKAYSTNAATFIKMEEMLNDHTGLTMVAAKGVTYWFDDDTANKKTTTDLSGIYSLDVNALEDGLHVLHYHVVGEDDLPYAVTSTMFLKDASQYVVHELARITKYTYWLNNDNSTAKTVTLDQPTNAYTLMSLLPLEKMPIRSSMFHLEMVDGIPTLYAKNTFNIRFYDSQGYFVDNFIDNERTFIDYSVSQQVTEAELLESGKTVTIDRPAENTIKWYSLNAVPGDSLEFKLDHAATIQLYSPSGEEIYHADGAKSVKWDGCHVWESGTFYLALHDMTATNGNTISLSYNHIDKYAVLRQNVKVVGNGGYTTITFEGNGFRDLYAIDLFDTEQNSIECLSLGIESNACITPTFDFTGVKLGIYDALFHYTEGDVIVKNAITVEEATDITIDTKIKTHDLLVGRSKPYFEVTIVCPNGGNNTAYDVPVGVSFSAPKGSISYIDIVNKEIPTLAELLQSDGMSDEDRLEIQQISDQLGDTYDFVTKEWVDEETGAEMETLSICLSTTIAPESSNTIKFNVASSSDVKTTIDTPYDWMPIYMMDKRTPPRQKPQVCAGLEKWKCFFDRAAAVAGYISTIGNFITPITAVTGTADCATSLVSYGWGKYTDNRCGGPRESFSPISYRATQKAIGGLWGPVISCVSAVVPGAKIAKTVIGSTSAVVQTTNSIEQCSSAWDNDIVGQSRLVYSKDPNDIYGYTSPSGSNFIAEDVKDVSYTIEFENDPESATASAHDIYLTDELDASLFDLSTYKPKSIRIGNKTAELSGEKDFVTTVDMRPEIYAIAQVEGTFNESTGIMNWHISSLDPMTMEPTNEIANGILPVNTDGQGIGEASFDIRLKDGLTHGTEIPNKATIVFDTNEPIETPTWTNTIDAVRPTSHIVEVTQLDGQTAEVTIETTDELSGPWKYDVYVQYGTGSAWMKAAENVPFNTKAKVKIYPTIDHGFYVIATDEAGNIETKDPVREVSLMAAVMLGDVNNDGNITAQDASLVLQAVAGKIELSAAQRQAADVNGDGDITAQDASLILQYVAGKISW